jgi:hypothetical protein
MTMAFSGFLISCATPDVSFPGRELLRVGEASQPRELVHVARAHHDAGDPVRIPQHLGRERVDRAPPES